MTENNNELRNGAHPKTGSEHRERKWFEPTEKCLTVSAYVFLVGVFYVLCVMVGLNIHRLPDIGRNLVSVMSPLIYGFLIAFVLSPGVSFIETRIFFKWREKRQRLKHILSIILTYVLVITLFVLAVVFLVPQVVNTYTEFFSQFTTNVTHMRNWIAGILEDMPGAEKSGAYVFHDVSSDFRMEITDHSLVDSLNTPSGVLLKGKNTTTQDEVQEMFDGVVQNIVSSVTKALPGVLSSALNVLLEAKNVLLGVIISVYFLVCKKSLLGTFNRLAHTWMPPKMYRRSAWLIVKAKGIFRDYIVVRLLDSFIVALITLVGLLIIRNPYALLVSVIIGMSALIPFIGPVLGIAVGALMMLVVGFEYAVGFAVIMVVVQMVDARFIEPMLNKGYSQHRLAGIWVFSAIILMSGLFGFLGLLFGIPLFAFVYSIAKDMCEKRLRRAGYPLETIEYKRDHVDGTER